MKNAKKQEGVTLIELLVAMLVFSSILIVVTSSVSFLLGGFRKIILGQSAQDELRYLSEFMSRELRTAQCGGSIQDCQMFTLNTSGAVGTVLGYEQLYPALEFINYKNQRVRYIFTRNASGYGEISRRCALNDGNQNDADDVECDDITVIDPGPRPMTSEKINVRGMTFIVNGDAADLATEVADQRQPLITIFLDVDYFDGKFTKNIFLQTSISPRHLQS